MPMPLIVPMAGIIVLLMEQVMTKMTMTSITGHNKSNIGTVGTVPDLRTKQSVVVESGLSPVVRNEGGMTLMEILVVIVIISVLASALLPAVTGGIKKSYAKKAEATISAIQSALDMYRRDWGYYPVSGSSTQRNGNQG